MTPELDRTRAWVRAFAMLCAVLGAMVLGSWAFNVTLLERVLPELGDMNPSTALGFVLAGAALWIAVRDPASLAVTVLAGLLIVLGVLRLAESLLGGLSAVNELLSGSALPLRPERMAPATAVSFLLSGTAFLLARRGGSWSAASQALTVAVGAICLVAVGGHLLDRTELFTVHLYSAMALHTALGFTVLAFGLACIRPDQGLVRAFRGSSAASAVARRLIPIALLLPMALSAAIVAIQNVEAFGTSFALALAAVLSSMSLVALIWWTARTVEQKERELTYGRRYVETTLASIGDAVVMTNEVGRVAFLNGTARALTGLRFHEARKTHVSEIFDVPEPSLRALLADPANGLRDGAVAFPGPTVVTARRGGTFTLDGNAAPISVDGRFLGMALVFRDVTEQHRQELALEHSRDDLHARLREIEQIYRSASIGMAVLDDELRYRRINDQLAEITGLDIEDHIGRTARDVLPQLPDDFEALPLSVIRTGQPLLQQSLAGEMPSQPGVIREWVVDYLPVMLDDGARRGVQVLVREVTTERQQRRTIEHYAERMSLASKAAGFGTFEVDVETGTAEWSRELVYLTSGNSEAGPLATPVTDVVQRIHEADRSRLRNALLSVTAKPPGDEVDVKFRFLRPSGDIRWALLRGRKSNVDNRLIGAIVDITDLEQTRRALADRVRALQAENDRKDEYLAILGHELRNPLGALANGIALLETGEHADWLARMMHRQVAQLTYLLNELLDLSRISLGKIQLRPEVLELAAVVTDAIETVRSAMESKQQRLDVRLSASIYASIDRTRFVQIVSNLLTNANKFTKEHGEITIELTHRGSTATLSVSDTGIGMSEEMMRRCFDQFSQQEIGQNGLGIGLSLVKSLVELHGGTISAHSDGLRKGSVFEVELPTVASKVEPLDEVPLPGSAVPEQPSSVLIVDDNLEAARMLARILERDGWKTTVVGSGEAALAAVENAIPAAILLDIGLPGIDGVVVAHRLRADARFAGLRLIATTGFGDEKTRRRIDDARFDDLLLKPLNLTTLKSRLRTLAVSPN